MSENNEYVATAAAEKRLREVLDDRLPLNMNSEDVAVALLAGAEIDYKPRTRKVTISLTLPEKATASKAIVEPEAGIVTAPEGTPVNEAPPQPHIVAFTPALDPDRDYEDVHFD